MPHHWPRSMQGVDFTVGPDFSWCLASNWHGRSCRWRLPSLKLTARPWKPMVGRWIFLLGRPIFNGYVSLLYTLRVRSFFIQPTNRQVINDWREFGWCHIGELQIQMSKYQQSLLVRSPDLMRWMATLVPPTFIWVKESTSYPNNKTTWICIYNKISISLTHLFNMDLL